MVPSDTVLGLIGFFAVASLFVMIVVRSNARNKEYMKHEGRKYGAERFYILNLFDGLPLAKNTFCKIFVGKDRVSVVGEGNTFSIGADKIIAAQAKTEEEIQKEIKSSAGKAIAGGLLFGPVGAIVGGMPGTKNKKVYKSFLIINYKNQQDEIAILSFTGDPFNCQKAAKEIAPLITRYRRNEVVEL